MRIQFRRPRKTMPNQDRSGGVLMLVILIGALLTLAVISSLRLTVFANRMTGRSHRYHQALAVAEAGLERAIHEMNEGNVSTANWSRTETVITDIQERLDKLEAMTKRRGPMTETIIVGQYTYGWPLMFMMVWDVQGYEFIPGQRPTAILDPYIRSGVQDFGSYGYIRWHTRHGTIHRMTDIYWSQALAQLAGLQVVALGLVGLIAAVRWLRARTRRR